MAKEDDETRPIRLPTTQRLHRAAMAIPWIDESAKALRDAGMHEEADVLDVVSRAVAKKIKS